MTVKQAITLTQLNVQGKKLAFKLDNDKYYCRNDSTINTLLKGFIDENAVIQYNDKEAGENVQRSASDAEHGSNIVSVEMLKLVLVSTKQSKTKRRAVERELEIIGEAVNRLLKLNSTIEISFARIIVDLRNKVIHSYDSIDNEIIWKVVMKDIPILKAEAVYLIELK